MMCKVQIIATYLVGMDIEDVPKVVIFVTRKTLGHTSAFVVSELTVIVTLSFKSG